MGLRFGRRRIYVSAGIVCIAVLIGAVIVLFPAWTRNTSYSGGIGGGFVNDFRGQILTTTSASTGIVDLQLTNQFNYPFQGIVVTDITPLVPGIIDNMTFIYNGTAVSPTNPLPIGQTAEALADFSSGVNIGDSYTVAAVSILTSGQTVTQTVSLGATAGSVSSIPIWSVAGTLYVHQGTENGTLTLEIQNALISGDVLNPFSITGVSFTTMVPNAGSNNSVDNVSGLRLTLGGNPVSQANPINPGEDATGSINVTGVTIGPDYGVNAIVTFSNGASSVEDWGFTAQPFPSCPAGFTTCTFAN